MSSLRPLATIALLAAVGVFLYMKINDSEPKLSPEMENWANSDLDIGDPVAGGPTASSPPSSGAQATPTGDAPPFSSAQLNPAPATASAPPAGDMAPAWTPGPLNVTEPPKADAESSPVARSAETPGMPAMPGMPGEHYSTDPTTTTPGASHDEGTNSAAAAAAVGATAAGAAAVAAATNGHGNDAAPVTPSADPATGASIDSPSTSPKTSMFSAARVAVQGALDRGELSQALLLLSDWYDDPSLTPAESQEVNELLAQLAGSVIYEGPPAHRILPAHIVQAGETLEAVANKYDVPPQLLAKINGIQESTPLQSGQELKVVRGPFSAVIDISERKMTLMLERRYAGQFSLQIDPTANIEEGDWKVDQKLLTPGGAGLYGQSNGPTEDRSLLLANLANPTSEGAVLRGPGNADPVGASLRGRIIHFKKGDVNDVYDILSVGLRVTIRR